MVKTRQKKTPVEAGQVCNFVRECVTSDGRRTYYCTREYEGKAVIGLCRNLIGLYRTNVPPLAREATAGSPTRWARQSNWSTLTQGLVGLKLAELVSAGSLFSFWGVPI
jgi:hypothetical protein